MRINVTKKSDTNTNLTVSAEAAEMQPIKHAVVQRLSANVRLPGFRSGKAPQGLVEKNLDQNVLQNEFLEEAVNHLYRSALNHEQLRPVSPPQVSIKKFVPFTTLEFEAEVEVLGDIKLADYTKIKKAKQPIGVNAKDVNDVLTSLRQRAADKKDVDRPAKSGDQVVIDFKGTDAKGQPVSGAEGKDYPLVLGSDSFIPGFEQNLIGTKAGEQKTFSLTFPKDYNVKALANKKVSFEVSVNKVQEVVEPTLDDAFAAKVGPFKDLGELKADIKKQLTAERQQAADQQFENELVQEITNASKVVIPKTLVDDQLERLEQEERQNLVYRGQTWEEHLKEEGLTDEQHREQKRPQAEERVKAGVVLSEIAEKERIEVTPEELEIRLQLLKGQYKDAAMQAELDKPENHQEIANRLLTEKTIAKLVGYATAGAT